tara:strand:+ start:795 stop:1067 length:273 start_codon:yes stop_codon:yes gene_type:complete
MSRKKEVKTEYRYSDYRGSEIIWSTEDIEAIAEELGITYLDFDDYDKILHDTFKNYGVDIMDSLRDWFVAQTWNHAKALQMEYNKKNKDE